MIPVCPRLPGRVDGFRRVPQRSPQRFLVVPSTGLPLRFGGAGALVVPLTQQGEPVKVGGATDGPLDEVVHIAVIGGLVTVRSRASTVDGVQNDSVIS